MDGPGVPGRTGVADAPGDDGASGVSVGRPLAFGLVGLADADEGGTPVLPGLAVGMGSIDTHPTRTRTSATAQRRLTRELWQLPN